MEGGDNGPGTNDQGYYPVSEDAGINTEISSFDPRVPTRQFITASGIRMHSVVNGGPTLTVSLLDDGSGAATVDWPGEAGKTIRVSWNSEAGVSLMAKAKGALLYE